MENNTSLSKVSVPIKPSIISGSLMRTNGCASSFYRPPSYDTITLRNGNEQNIRSVINTQEPLRNQMHRKAAMQNKPTQQFRQSDSTALHIDEPYVENQRIRKRAPLVFDGAAYNAHHEVYKIPAMTDPSRANMVLQTPAVKYPCPINHEKLKRPAQTLLLSHPKGPTFQQEQPRSSSGRPFASSFSKGVDTQRESWNIQQGKDTELKPSICKSYYRNPLPHQAQGQFTFSYSLENAYATYASPHLGNGQFEGLRAQAIYMRPWSMESSVHSSPKIIGEQFHHHSFPNNSASPLPTQQNIQSNDFPQPDPEVPPAGTNTQSNLFRRHYNSPTGTEKQCAEGIPSATNAFVEGTGVNLAKSSIQEPSRANLPLESTGMKKRSRKNVTSRSSPVIFHEKVDSEESSATAQVVSNKGEEGDTTEKQMVQQQISGSSHPAAKATASTAAQSGSSATQTTASIRTDSAAVLGDVEWNVLTAEKDGTAEGSSFFLNGITEEDMDNVQYAAEQPFTASIEGGVVNTAEPDSKHLQLASRTTGGAEAGAVEDKEIYDGHGFVISEKKQLVAALLRYSLWYSPKAARREKRWALYIHHDLTFKNRKVLKQLIRKGVPSKLRNLVWSQCLGINELKQKHEGLYASLTTPSSIAGLDTVAARQIELDLKRTFPNNIKYKNPNGEASLRRILQAFALYKPHINYCQSLNFVAGTCLLVLPEETAFFVMCQIIDSEIPNKGMQISGYYAPGMASLRRDLKVLDTELKKRVPQAHKKLGEHEVEIEWICTEWMLCLFSTLLPMETTLRIWDVIINEGVKILFRVALAIFLHFKKDFVMLNSLEEIMTFFKSREHEMVDHNTILKIAMKQIKNFSVKEISAYRVSTEKLVN